MTYQKRVTMANSTQTYEQYIRPQLNPVTTYGDTKCLDVHQVQGGHASQLHCYH